MAIPQKSISIILEDGSFDSIILVEDTAWNGCMFSSPRSAVSELLKKKEASYYGVYFLLSAKQIYVGQASELKTRIKTHSSKKAWWDKVVLLTTKNDEFTHNDIDFIEAFFIDLAKQNKQYKCDNVKGGKYKVTLSERIKLEQYIDEALFLLENVIDVKVFSKSAKTPTVSPASPTATAPTIKDKKTALDFLSTKGLQLKSRQCTYASLQTGANKKFWANPKKEFVDQDWDIILNDTESSELLHVHIPAKTFKAVTKKQTKNFVVRKDKPDVLDINIYKKNLIDMYSHIDISKYVVNRYQY